MTLNSNRNLHRKNLNKFLTVFSTAFYFFFSIMQLSLFNVLGPFLIANLKINSLELGVVSSSYLYGLALTLLPAGYLLDRFSTKKIVIITFLFSVGSALLVAICLNIFSLFTYRLITGIANGFAFLAALRTASQMFPKKNALANGTVIAFGMSGGIFASILFPYFFTHFGLTIGLFINFSIGLIILLNVYVFLSEPYNFDQKPLQDQILKDFKVVAYNSQNWFCGIYTGLLNLSVYVLAALWGDLYLMERYHFTNQKSALIIAMIFLGLIVGSPMWGWFSDKLQNRKAPMFFGAFCSLLTILFILLTKHPTNDILYMLFFILGVSTSSQILSYPTISESNKPNLISTATGFAALLINLIGAFAQIIYGWLLSFLWSGQMKNNVPIYLIENLMASLSLLVVAFGLACLMVFFIKETKKTFKT